MKRSEDFKIDTVINLSDDKYQIGYMSKGNLYTFDAEFDSFPEKADVEALIIWHMQETFLDDLDIFDVDVNDVDYDDAIEESLPRHRRPKAKKAKHYDEEIEDI